MIGSSSNMADENRRSKTAAIMALALTVFLAVILLAPEVAYANQRQNVNVISESKTALIANVAATVPPKPITESQRSYTEMGSLFLGCTANCVINGIPWYSAKPKIASLKNAKKSVADIEFSSPWSQDGKYYGSMNYTIIPKKAGQTKITFTVKVGSKVVKKCAFNVTVHKYDKAFSSFKIGKVDLAKKLDTTGTYVQLTEKKLKGKLSMKAAPGWIIENSHLFHSVKNGPDVATPLNAGKSYTITSGRICVMLYNTVDGRYRTVNLALVKADQLSAASSALLG